MLVMRDCGESFHGQLSWDAFAGEFTALMERTLLFQQLTDLVHGDIHEGNILFDASANTGNQLKLIDWDEALRKQPCSRKTDTDEEKRRYPCALVSFPEEYTKHQFLVVFEVWLLSYYSEKEKAWKIQRNRCQTKEDALGLVSSTNCRFKAMLRFLQATEVD